ncbi:thiamine kinase-like enzyme [Nakamurella sp. UYEF19]|uniref:choline/ethanolamine kinase family protein n=1 Tax=Nakamurella sp. UYEF19 TaxID=1756392 RepID=UPI0033940F12
MIAPSPDVFALAVDLRLDMVPALRDTDRVVETLPGGLTNSNFKISTGRGTFVARLSRPGADLLAIDRHAEYRNSLAAAASGVAPQVVDFVPEAGVLLIEWLPGRTLQPADLEEPETLRAIAAACHRLHAGAPFVSDFDMFEIADRYLRTALDRKFRLPDRYLEFTAHWTRLRRVLSMDRSARVPCHNDLLAANFIENQGTVALIDYEYSGNNDPSFELGNIWSESNLPDEHLDLLVDAYFGGHDESLIARCRLQALVSQYGWTLWGVIQHAVSELDFDFWEWAMEKYRRAVITFDSPDFAELLAAAHCSPADRSRLSAPTVPKENKL